MLNWILGILKLLMSGVMAWFKGNKAQEYKTEAEAAKEALNSVGDSIKVEDEIERKQADVENEKITKNENDAFGDNDWNNK